MRKLFLASVALVALAVPASAQQSLAIGGGLNFNHVNSATAAQTAGLAAAGSLAGAQQQSIGTGFAVASPAGTIAAGVGASVGQAGTVSGAGSLGNGAAQTAGTANGFGVGVGGGFANQLP
jgi:hypothetical protein